MTGYRDGCYKMIKMLIHPKDMVVLNTYAPNNRDTRHAKQKLTELKGEIDKCTPQL